MIRTDTFLKEDALAGPDVAETICISIVIPLDRDACNYREDLTTLYKAVGIAQQHLTTKYSQRIAKKISQYLDELMEDVIITDNAAGIGLFVSDQVKFCIPFVFPVAKKVIVSDSLELREVLYQISYSQSYMLLHLTGQEARLFNGNLNTLKEIRCNHFPILKEDNYWYSRPLYLQAYRSGAEINDKPDGIECYERFLRETDEALSPYLINGTKVILTGEAKSIANFRKLTCHTNNIIGQFSCRNNEGIHTLSNAALYTVYVFVDMQKQHTISSFESMLTKGQAVTGLPQIWKAVLEGRGHKLIIEKDYEQTAFLTSTDNRLYITPPSMPYMKLTNAVNSLIKMIIKKKGVIVLVENGLLTKHQRIGLVY